MPSGPPPYSPFGQDPRMLKFQRRMMRDQAKAQRDQLRLRARAMHRGSVLGPILAIATGVVFLLIETGRIAGNRIWEWYARWWPLLLVLGGATLLLEWVVDQLLPRNPAQPYVRRSAGRAVALLIVLAVAGAVLRETRDMRNLALNGFSINPDNVAEFFGSRHESEQNLDVALPAEGTLTVDLPHGDLTVTGASTDGRAHLVVHKQVYASSDSGADEEARELSPQIATSGSSTSISVASRGGASVDLDLTLPPTASVILNANHGDIHVDRLQAFLKITANHGDVSLSSITGPVTSHINNNGSTFSVHQVKGSVTLEGHADDLTLSNIYGAVSLTGDFYGDTHLEQIDGPVRFHTSRTDFQLARLDGQIDISSEEITGDQLAGPVVLTTRNRNLHLERVAGPLSVTNRNGTVDITAAPPLAAVTVQNRDGGVALTLPQSASFMLSATTDDGSIENDFSLGAVNHEQRAVLTGTVGVGGPLMRIDNNHGDIAVHKANVGPLLPAPPHPPVPPLPSEDPARQSGADSDHTVTVGPKSLRLSSDRSGNTLSIDQNGIRMTSRDN